MREYVVLGLPPTLANDGWWIDPKANFDPSVKRRLKANKWVWLLAGLVAIADFLFWQSPGPGLSLAVFLIATAGAVRIAHGSGLARQDWPGLLVCAAVLPLVDRVQIVSVGFGVSAVLVYAVWLHLGAWHRLIAHVPHALRRFTQSPRHALKSLNAVRSQARSSLQEGKLRQLARGWALPCGLGMCFAALLIGANPVLADWAATVTFLEINPVRGLFWLGIALLVWPLIALQQPEVRLRPVAWALPQWLFGGVVNARSVASSLWLFNAMFAVQTAMDAVYLWGDAALPAGMSHAQYAHRGAYPLVATALLAGAFALVSRVYAAESRVVRGLLLGWIAQNVALVISALFRLQVYVEAWGLTHLRAYAAIWMGVVAAGLMLVAWQVMRGRANDWLTVRSAALGAGVLYGCCFVNFAGLVADHNLTALREGRLPMGLDAHLICTGLGPDAWAAVARHKAAGWSVDCARTSDRFAAKWLDVSAPEIKGWRDWSYRSWQVLREANAYSGRR